MPAWFVDNTLHRTTAAANTLSSPDHCHDSCHDRLYLMAKLSTPVPYYSLYSGMTLAQEVTHMPLATITCS